MSKVGESADFRKESVDRDSTNVCVIKVETVGMSASRAFQMACQNYGVQKDSLGVPC